MIDYVSNIPDYFNDDQVILAQEMRRLSREYLDTEWHIGLEFMLWDALKPESERNPHAKQIPLSDDDRAELRRFHEKCGGWVAYPNDNAEHVGFVPTKTWELVVERFDSPRARRDTHYAASVYFEDPYLARKEAEFRFQALSRYILEQWGTQGVTCVGSLAFGRIVIEGDLPTISAEQLGWIQAWLRRSFSVTARGCPDGIAELEIEWGDEP